MKDVMTLMTFYDRAVTTQPDLEHSNSLFHLCEELHLTVIINLFQIKIIQINILTEILYDPIL